MKLFLQPMRSKPLNVVSSESFPRLPLLAPLRLSQAPAQKERLGDARRALNRQKKSRLVVAGASSLSVRSQATN